MSLEDKIINPMAPAELPGQRSEPLPKAGKKRRKSGVTAGAASAKPKKGDLDDEVGGDSTAVLTLGPSDDGLRRAPKKMLFESASDGATLAFAGPAIRRETPRPAVVPPAAPVAKAPPAAKAAPAPVAAAPTPEVEEIAPVEAELERKDEATKAPVFEVASVGMPEPEPQPEPEDAASEAQPELPLSLAPADDDVAAAPAESEPIAEVKIEESFGESLTLGFDATLADGLAERAAAVQEDAPEPEVPAPAPPFVPESFTLKAPVLMTPVETVQEEPAPVAVEPTPAPPYVAPTVPVAETPKVESKPESEAPVRGLSRSEAIARAARMSARATPPRPMPTAAETLAAARTAQQQMRAADLPKHPGDIYGYWTRVKNGRRFPSRADFDAEQVAEHWPNSMLLTCGSGGAGSHGNFSSVLRLGANRRNRPEENLNFTSMITEWILTTGGEAARAGTPVQDTEVFPTPEGTHAYKIVALPLSENQTRVDHVLCHLSRS
jgi:hypothetical protein